MKGPVALHGGGEFLPGDEPFLRAILELTTAVNGVVRVAVVPSAAARGRPELAGAHGVAAFQRVAADLRAAIEVEAVPVVDRASAEDPALAARLAGAALIHLPGGDPDLIPTLYPGSPAWAAMRAAHDAGAVVAGASAGAMAIAAWTWTGRDVVPGLGLVPGVVVVPHADAASWPRVLARFASLLPADAGLLGVGERTGVIIPAGTAGKAGTAGADGTAGAGGTASSSGAEGPWRVVGPGEVRWLPPGEHDPDAARIARGGESFVPERRAA